MAHNHAGHSHGGGSHSKWFSLSVLVGWIFLLLLIAVKDSSYFRLTATLFAVYFCVIPTVLLVGRFIRRSCRVGDNLSGGVKAK
jgi:hypothetical protein